MIAKTHDGNRILADILFPFIATVLLTLEILVISFERFPFVIVEYNMSYSGNPTPAPTTTTIIWNASELNKFITLMIDNVRNGQKSNSTFSKVGWNNIKAGLEATFQRPFRKEQLCNKINKLRGDYNSFRRLLETMGFGWDSNTRTAIAADSVWENAIKANPNWTKFRNSGLPWWPELLEVFSNSSAQGDRGVSQHTVGK
ncbi:uncharacterized protein At2g29880-like [Macadamia integrifolia]|uniref:uncharacterized protein At2g29880-like n=1 Tax=Macadamia integrifolia TaxID=60698 RepID=UPI001C4E42AF|nr:uncharacterized protein At2g29880-like [Macadamia integrifolia]